MKIIERNFNVILSIEISSTFINREEERKKANEVHMKAGKKYYADVLMKSWEKCRRKKGENDTIMKTIKSRDEENHEQKVQK
jgi:predicted CopG family antitoxin